MPPKHSFISYGPSAPDELEIINRITAAVRKIHYKNTSVICSLSFLRFYASDVSRCLWVQGCVVCEQHRKPPLWCQKKCPVELFSCTFPADAPLLCFLSSSTDSYL